MSLLIMKMHASTYCELDYSSPEHYHLAYGIVGLKFEMTNQDSAGGKNVIVLTSV